MAGSTKRTWDPAKVFDLSAEELSAVEERNRKRLQLKSEYMRKVQNPNRGPIVFDPAVQRFLSMRADYWYQFKPTASNGVKALLFTAIPIAFFWNRMYVHKKTLDDKCRRGEIAYKDRDWKLIN